MSLDITVRGSAEAEHPAERATLSLSVVHEGPDREQVRASGARLHAELIAKLDDLGDAVTSWSSDSVRVMTYRPTDDRGLPLAPIHVVRVPVRAELVDFEVLSTFVDAWSSRDGIEVHDVAWDVLAANRRGYEADVRRAAVDDAVLKAQAYADAVGRGVVVPYRIADPGMLADQPMGGGGPPMYARAMAFDTGGGPALELTPAPIEIRVEVDARFTAG